VTVFTAEIIDDNALTNTEMLVAKLLFGWQCPRPWQQLARFVYAIVDDAFFDFFLILCIVFNTILMSLDHAGISDQMAYVLLMGNYVSETIC